jgi:hypothetical protein
MNSAWTAPPALTFRNPEFHPQRVFVNGEKRNAYRIFVGKPEGKRPLGRPRRRWVDNIKIDRMGWYGLDRSGLG